MRLRAGKNPQCFPAPAILFALLTACIACGPAAAAGYMESKRVAGYEVSIRLDRNPPILGENNLEIEIRRANAQNVADAVVLVNYYMPPMPRMAPMNYRTDAPYRNGKYKTVLRLIMEGPWVIAVKINRLNRTITAKFNINVR